MSEFDVGEKFNLCVFLINGPDACRFSGKFGIVTLYFRHWDTLAHLSQYYLKKKVNVRISHNGHRNLEEKGRYFIKKVKDKPRYYRCLRDYFINDLSFKYSLSVDCYRKLDYLNVIDYLIEYCNKYKLYGYTSDSLPLQLVGVNSDFLPRYEEIKTEGMF